MTEALALPDRSARRAALLDAADRVVAREGLAASMASVAAEAGVSKPILYRHFGDKGGLTAALAERHTARLWEVLRAALGTSGTPRDRVEATVGAYLAAIEAQPQLYRFLTAREDEPEQVRGFTHGLAALLTRGIALELGVAPGPREQVWARGIVGMVQATGDWWLGTDPRGADGLAREELARHLTDLLFGAYGAATR